MNTSLFEDLLTLIKKKSSIRNTEQAVELISLFIFLHYIKLYFYENDIKVSAPWEREPELWRKYIPKGSSYHLMDA